MKKGFTLIELLSIIVILGIILAIGIPVVNKVIDNTRQKLYEETAKNIEKATESYVAKNLTMLNSLKNDGDYIEITLKELVDAGVLDNNIQNPITKGMFNLNSYAVRITFQNSNYIYKFNPIYIREGLVADWRFDDFQEPTENLLSPELRTIVDEDAWSCYDDVTPPYHTWGIRVQRELVPNGYLNIANSLRVFNISGSPGLLGAVA